MITQGSKAFAVENHVVLVINSARQGGQVGGTAPGAGAIGPVCERSVMACELYLQLVTAQPEPSQLSDVLVQLLVEPQVCRHLVGLCGLEVCRICEKLPANPGRQLCAAHQVMAALALTPSKHIISSQGPPAEKSVAILSGS